ncbi:hypothetical protein LR48_Vigan02g122300 [Vigna angularis]|uniref:Uncharacterized protein n=1 Tax=Phaseolus angularis TaxID=3914 RepID=A0A0L9TWW1_PHAAN|nr:hypothetical protein LR48_Vigan02g122300 [Vigna angularis]
MHRFMDEAEMRRSTKLWSMETVEAVREGASDAALLEAAAIWNMSVTLSSVFVAGGGDFARWWTISVLCSLGKVVDIDQDHSV